MDKFIERDTQELIKELSEESPEFKREYEKQKPYRDAQRAKIEARLKRKRDKA